MTDFRDVFELQLADAAARLDREAAPARPAPQRSRLPWNRRRPLMVALAALVVSGGAVATTTQDWSPFVGDPNYPDENPTISSAPPPRAQINALAVLRRPPEEADRDAAVRATLRFLGPTVEGVRTAYIRRLAVTADGRAVTLVPVARWDNVEFAPVDNALCALFATSNGGVSGSGCWSLRTIRIGRAIGAIGTTFYGMTTDAVRTVQVAFEDGRVVTVEPQNNFFTVDNRGSLLREMTFLDAQGRTIRTVDPSKFKRLP